ncbi:MAG: hypothetical protein HY304_04505, partial [candidate division Zixibacteria bacterium]|nr:hypothetical protein [candidate division Zixibacteria bacterium]
MPHRLRTHSPSPLQGHAPVRLVDVAFPLPIRREFTFGVPSGWSEDVHPGDRVVAPLAGRDATGVIVAATTGAAPEGLKHLRRPAVCGWR